MASRGGSARRVPETEATITYVQCDGLVSFETKWFSIWFCSLILESNLKAIMPAHQPMFSRFYYIIQQILYVYELVFCKHYAPNLVTLPIKVFATI